MARMFRGQSRHKVDGKGRVSIPAAFRRVLEEGDPNWTAGTSPAVAVHYGTASRLNYLECYTLEGADAVSEGISRLQRGSAKRRKLERYFNAQIHEATLDDNGRLLMSAQLRDAIGLEGEAVFVAVGETFQIWKPEVYDAEFNADIDDIFDGLEDGADPLVLLDDTDTNGED